MSRERHRDTETLYKQSELSRIGTTQCGHQIPDRERSLRVQISEVQRRIGRHREEHFAIVGSEGSIPALNSRQQSLLGQLRATQFAIDHHRALRSELLGDSLSVELDEAKCMKRYAAAKQTNELLRQQISVLEADVSRLITTRNRPYPSTSDTHEIQAQCVDLDSQIHALEMEITQTIAIKDSDESLQSEASSVINELVSELTLLESHYGKQCDSKMESLSDLMELHEKKLRLYQMQRECLDEFGPTVGEVEIDFESGDIEFDKTRLKKLHKELKFCDEARNACSVRIDELKRILSTAIHV